MQNKILQKAQAEWNIKEDTFLKLDHDCHITCSTKGVHLYLVFLADLHLELDIQDEVTIYSFQENHNIEVVALVRGKGNLNYHFQAMSRSKIKNGITIRHYDSLTKSKLYCHGVSYDQGDLSFLITGDVPSSVKGCVCNQDSKIHILGNAVGKIDPKLYTEEYDVEANHAAYLGPFKDEELFYLATKGIDLVSGYHLLLKAFLLGDAANETYQSEVEKRLNAIIGEVKL